MNLLQKIMASETCFVAGDGNTYYVKLRALGGERGGWGTGGLAPEMLIFVDREQN